MPDQTGQAVQAQAQPQVAAGGPLILIVEDDPSLSKMYALKFKNEGFRVSVARDGAKGLELAASEHPNAILLDMMLPKYSGIEFLEQLQQHLRTISIPIIALSNLTEKQEADLALKLGVKEYLAKATNTPEQVVEKVKKYLKPTHAPASSSPPQPQG